MPRIENANGLTLDAIATQLDINDTQDTRELRSTGNDLYVKEGKAAHTNLISRKAHRNNAIELIRDSLVEELRTTKDDARRIFAGVIGHAPDRITVGDVGRLHHMTEVAQGLIASGMSIDDAFVRAQQDFQNAYLPLRGSEHSSENEGTHCEAPSARPDNCTEITTKPPESSEDDSDFSTSDSTLTLISHGKPETFPEICQRISGWPPYEASSHTERGDWYNFTERLAKPGRFPLELLKSLPIDLRTTMHMALKERLKALREFGAPVTQLAGIVRSMIWLNKTYELSELMPKEERQTLDRFLSEVSESESLSRNFTHWKVMDEASRQNTIHSLIDLHAGQFGYTDHKPLLEFQTISASDNSHNFANTHDVARTLVEKLEIYTNVPEFEDAREVFNTVVHELTHWHQCELELRLKRGQIDAASPNYQQARMISATLNSPNRSYLSNTLGFPEDEAFDAYRHSLVEEHAYHSADYATAKVKKIFPAGDSPEESS